MSASLVGSEMCIRDRMADVPSADVPLPGGRLREDVGRQHLAMSDQDPVSYTHLTLPTICSV
eukprot:14230552-Alexandrium_andersonii.AAC.1